MLFEKIIGMVSFGEVENWLKNIMTSKSTKRLKFGATFMTGGVIARNADETEKSADPGG